MTENRCAFLGAFPGFLKQNTDPHFCVPRPASPKFGIVNVETPSEFPGRVHVGCFDVLNRPCKIKQSLRPCKPEPTMSKRQQKKQARRCCECVKYVQVWKQSLMAETRLRCCETPGLNVKAIRSFRSRPQLIMRLRPFEFVWWSFGWLGFNSLFTLAG